MKRVSVGIVGAGFAANIHVESLKKVAGLDIEISAVVSTDRDRATAFARAHGIPTAYTTQREMFADPDIDVVCVCVPNGLHERTLIDAIEAGKHVICEKPLTGGFGVVAAGESESDRARRELENARASIARIQDAVRLKGVQFMYAENWVYAPAVTKSKRLLEVAGGAILDMRAEESHSGSHAAASRRRETAGGGALLVMGSHPIAAALHLKEFESALHGESPTRVESVTAEIAPLYASEAVRRGQKQDWLVSDWDDVETWANLVMSFSDGSRAVINASFAMLGGVRNVFEIFTTNAVYQNAMTPNSALQVFTPDPQAFGAEYLHEKVESRTGWISASPDEDWVRGYPQEMQNFMESVADGTEPISGLRLASDVVEVVYSGYLSAATGQRVLLG